MQALNTHAAPQFIHEVCLHEARPLSCPHIADAAFASPRQPANAAASERSTRPGSRWRFFLCNASGAKRRLWREGGSRGRLRNGWWPSRTVRRVRTGGPERQRRRASGRAGCRRARSWWRREPRRRGGVLRRTVQWLVASAQRGNVDMRADDGALQRRWLR